MDISPDKQNIDKVLVILNTILIFINENISGQKNL